MSISYSSVDEIEQISDNHHQFIEKRTYSSHFCSKTFSTPMANGGHRNTYKVQDAKKLKVEAHHNNLPYLNSSRLSGVNPFPSPEMRMESMAYQPKPSFLGQRVDSSSSSLSRKNWHLERSTQEIHNKIRRERYYGPMTSTRPSAALAPPHPVKSTMFFGTNFFKPSTPLAPPPPAKSTMFSGVPDFFKPSTPLAPLPLAKSTMFFGVPNFFKPSVAPTNPPSDGASISGVVIVDEEDEEKDLNLDLKL